MLVMKARAWPCRTATSGIFATEAKRATPHRPALFFGPPCRNPARCRTFVGISVADVLPKALDGSCLLPIGLPDQSAVATSDPNPSRPIQPPSALGARSDIERGWPLRHSVPQPPAAIPAPQSASPHRVTAFPDSAGGVLLPPGKPLACPNVACGQHVIRFVAPLSSVCRAPVIQFVAPLSSGLPPDTTAMLEPIGANVSRIRKMALHHPKDLSEHRRA